MTKIISKYKKSQNIHKTAWLTISHGFDERREGKNVLQKWYVYSNKENSWLWRNKTKQLWQTEPKYGNAITEPKYGGTRYEGNKKYIYISRYTRLKIALFNPFFKQTWQNSFHILWLLFLQPYRPLCLLLQPGDYSYIFFY